MGKCCRLLDLCQSWMVRAVWGKLLTPEAPEVGSYTLTQTAPDDCLFSRWPKVSFPEHSTAQSKPSAEVQGEALLGHTQRAQWTRQNLSPAVEHARGHAAPQLRLSSKASDKVFTKGNARPFCVLITTFALGFNTCWRPNVWVPWLMQH